MLELETILEVPTKEAAPVAPAKRTPSPIDQVWNFFISVKLAIFTLIQTLRAQKQESTEDFPKIVFNILAFYLLVACLWFQQWYGIWLISLAPLLPAPSRRRCSITPPTTTTVFAAFGINAMTGAAAPSSKLAAFLASPDRAGPYRLRPKQGVQLADAAQTQGLRLFALDLGNTVDKTAWLVGLGQGLGFPEWYGANFDALYDCLTDGEWMPPHGCLLQLSGFAALAEDGTDTLIAILQAAADEWREQGRPLWAALDAPGLDLDPLPA